MTHAVVRYATLIIGLVASGLICAMAAGFLTSPRGAPGPTIFHAQSPVAALLAIVVCLALATGVACVVGSIINAAVGLFVLGAGMFVLAGRLETVQELAFAAADSSPKAVMGAVALETILWAGLMFGCVAIVFRVTGGFRDVEPERSGAVPDSLSSPQAWRAAAAGALVLPAVWFLAQSTMKGQMVGSVFLGAMVAGLAGRLLSPHVQPKLLFVSPIVFGAVGYLIGMMMTPDLMGRAFVVDALPALCRPMPIDYAAGSIAGVAMGLGWARTFLHHEEEPAASTAPARP